MTLKIILVCNGTYKYSVGKDVKNRVLLSVSFF